MLARCCAILLASLLLPACQTPEEIAAADDAQCRSYGAKPDSDAYISCRVAQQKIRSDEDIASSTADVQRNKTCTKIGNTINCF